MKYKVNGENIAVRASCPRWVYLITSETAVFIGLEPNYKLILYLYSNQESDVRKTVEVWFPNPIMLTRVWRPNPVR